MHQQSISAVFCLHINNSDDRFSTVIGRSLEAIHQALCRFPQLPQESTTATVLIQKDLFLEEPLLKG
jgi:hypothetical protein